MSAAPSATVLGRFGSGEEAVAAVRALRARGERNLDAYSPHPLPELSDALGLRPSPVPRMAAAGAVVGAVAGYGIQWFANVADYPIDVGGRPVHGPLAFLPVTFELAVLCCALSIVVGLLLRMGLPRPWHPVFEVDEFRSSSLDGYWVGVRVEPARDPQLLAREMESLGGRSVHVVEIAE